MKPTQRTRESLGEQFGQTTRVQLEKKPTAPALMAPAASGVEPTKPLPAFGIPPAPAVWNRYIDSRMKQFGTR